MCQKSYLPLPLPPRSSRVKTLFGWGIYNTRLSSSQKGNLQPKNPFGGLRILQEFLAFQLVWLLHFRVLRWSLVRSLWSCFSGISSSLPPTSFWKKLPASLESFLLTWMCTFVWKFDSIKIQQYIPTLYIMVNLFGFSLFGEKQVPLKTRKTRRQTITKMPYKEKNSLRRSIVLYVYDPPLLLFII